MRDRQICRTEAEAMATLGEHMKFGGNLRVLKRLEVDERAFDMCGVVVLCLKQERRRYLLGRLK